MMVKSFKTGTQERCKPLLLVGLIVCMGLLMVNFASSLKFDNIKSEKDITFDGKSIVGNYLLEKYKPIEIKNLFGFGRTQFEGYISQHTETCGEDCSSTIEIQTGQDGILVDEVIFKTLQKDESWIEQDVRSSKFSYWGDVSDYETQCIKLKEVCNENINGTTCSIPEECSQIKIGSHKGWINYNLGQELLEGIYTVKLEADKKPSRTVDWVIKTNGEWLESWATWGNISSGDDAEVILNSPADNAIVYYPEVTFNATAEVTGGATLVNMSLWTNESGTWEAKNTTNIMGFGDYNDTKNFAVGTDGTGETTYTFTASAKSIGYVETARAMWNAFSTNPGVWTIDIKQNSSTLATGTLVPSDNSVSNITFQYIDYSSPIQVGEFQIVYTRNSGNAVLVVGANQRNYVGTLFNYTNQYEITRAGGYSEYGAIIYRNNGINFSIQTWNRTLTASTLWNVQACDSDGDCGFSTSNYTVLLDSAAPTITIASGNGTQDYGILTQNYSINYTITDVNLDSCWIDYNETNTTIPCTSGMANSTNFTLVKDLYNATIYANDSVGNINSTFIEWDYVFFEETSTFEGIVYETDSKTFEINITTGLTILTQSGNLIYNDTTYSASSSCASGVCTFSKVMDIPLITSGESQNRSFYWTLTLFDGSTSYDLNTSESIQNTTRIHLEKCAGIYTTQTVNFTAYYETNLTRINPFYITGTFDTWLGSGAVYRTQSFNEASTAELKLCITPTNKTQYSNAQIEYKFENENLTFIPRNYFFQNKTLTNISEEINLFLLEAEDSTSFIIKVQDQKLSPVTEALVYIQKYYPSDGKYRTIQIAKTDSNGETLGFYETETTDYKHTIIKNGVTLLETAQQKVVGKSVPFTLTFTIGQALGYPWTSFEDNVNVDTNLTFDKDTNIVTFNYIENTTGYVTAGQLLVFQNSLTNSTTTIICNVTSTEASATLTCDLSAYNGTFTAISYINGESQNIIMFTITQARDVFGNDGLFLGMMIILTAGFAMMWNPAAGIISINAAVIFVNIIGFISVSPIFIFGMIGISIITIILLKT